MSLKRDWDLLFSKYDLRAVLDNQLSQINDKVLKVPKTSFSQKSDEEISAAIASDLVIAPLQLVEDEISVSQADTKVDVSRDFDRAVLDRSRPAYIDGIEVTFHLPYRGDKELWYCRPNRYTLNPPRAVVDSTELRFPYSRPGRDIASTKKSFEEDVRDLKTWLPWVNEQVNSYNASVEEAVRQRVARRRQELSQADQDLGSLGYKVRTAGNESPTRDASPELVKRKREAARSTANRTYDVALSFAGEDREYVEQVAQELREMGVSVFYDRFEEVDLWGKDLAEHLGRVYGQDSRFVVLFLSEHYAAKAWPTHEKRFALGRQLQAGGERLLPVRFDDTEVPGVAPTIGYLDLRVLTPKKLAELIRQKVDRAEAERGGASG